MLYVRSPERYMPPKWRAEPLAALKTNLSKLPIVIIKGREGALGGRMVVKENLGGNKEISY